LARELNPLRARPALLPPPRPKPGPRSLLRFTPSPPQDVLGPEKAAHMVFTSGGLQSVRPEDAPEESELPEMRAPMVGWRARGGGGLTHKPWGAVSKERPLW
jgi:hypothetical protein